MAHLLHVQSALFKNNVDKTVSSHNNTLNYLLRALKEPWGCKSSHLKDNILPADWISAAALLVEIIRRQESACNNFTHNLSVLVVIAFQSCMKMVPSNWTEYAWGDKISGGITLQVLNTNIGSIMKYAPFNVYCLHCVHWITNSLRQFLYIRQ